VIAGIEELAELFSVFHDGVVEHADLEGGELLMRVRVTYLAAQVQEDFTTFVVRLSGVEDLAFSTWPKDAAATPEVLHAPDEIFKPPLDLLSGKATTGHLEIDCNQPARSAPHCGGTLTLRATSATVIDEAGKNWSLSELTALADAYWAEWKERNARR
jgi:hypothetical protein